MTVGLNHRIAAGKGADQHQQRRFREVEIGQQSVDRFELIAGIDEKPCSAAFGADGAIGVGGAFECAYRGGSNCDYPFSG